MGVVVKVLLNQQESKEQNYLTIVAGCQKNVNYPEIEDREFQHGLAFFYNDKYILNFVLNEDEVELLKSDVRVKAIDDLSYIMLAGKYALTIMKNRSMEDKRFKNSLEERIGELKEKQGLFMCTSYSEVQFVSEDEYGFVKGIRTAMLYPFTDSNLYSTIPEHTPEQEVVL